MDNKKLITPKKLQGFWELMPKEQIHFSSLLNKIEEIFKNSCFLPLDTPVLEYSETLLAKSGGDTDKEIYRFSKGDTDMCMRYDLTVPMARFVAMHENELNFPFKRYQIGKVYRGERPQKGRFREFYQCDADIIGNGELPLIADAECIRLLERCFEALSLDVTIEVSNRKILSGFIEEIGMTEKATDILIVLDKLNKLPLEQCLNQLNDIGLSDENSEKIIKLSKISGNIDEITKKLENFCKNELFVIGLNELLETDKYLKLMGAKNIIYNLAIIRGHNYYTGTVFEAFLNSSSSKSAVGAGGRFENLCGYFSTNKMPGVGMSVGITRLFDILMKENYFNVETSEIDCSVITFDETVEHGIELVSELRKNGVNAETFYANKSFKSKMKETNRRNIKFAIIVGEEEIQSKLYTLKDMFSGEQEKLSLTKIVEKIKNDRMCK